MTTATHAIGEIDVVTFKEPVGPWPAGTQGTVVVDLGRDKIVEISNDRGEALDLPVVPEAQLNLVARYS